MKIRLVRTAEQKLRLLYIDGTMARATPATLSDFLTGFKRPNNFFSRGDAGNWNENCFDMTAYPGETLAYLTDDDLLVVVDGTVFEPCMKTQTEMVDFLSAVEFGEKCNKSAEVVKVFCRMGRIPGAVKVGNSWLVPANAEYPVEPIRQRPSGRRPKNAKKEEASAE